MTDYLFDKKNKPEGTIVNVGDTVIGKDSFTVIAGPCSAESEEQVMYMARFLKSKGLEIMRASVYKPRTSPYSFQGLGEDGLKLLQQAREETGIRVETEVMDVRLVENTLRYVDMIRIGSRNMQNYDLLKEVGKTRAPVILKRGLSATIDEFLFAAEYVLNEGNPNLVLCERGIRTFEQQAYRNTLDLAAIPVLKSRTHLPVIVDPSHAAGIAYLVTPLSIAAAAIGADGLLVEVHPKPEEALSDREQALSPVQLEHLLSDLRPICKINARQINF